MISQVLALITLIGIAAASVPIIEPMHHAPQPYKFGYDIKDKHGEQYRQEEGNGGNAVKGSYGFTDDRGVKRQVDYVADHAGFRAQVKTNEPGTANQNPAAVAMISEAPYAGGAALGGLGYGLGGVGGYGNLGYGVAGGNGGVGGYGNLRYGIAGEYGGTREYGNLGYGVAASANGNSLNNGIYGQGYGLGYELGGNGLGVVGGLGYARYGY